MPSPSFTTWDIFVIALVVTLVIAVPVMTYYGSCGAVATVHEGFGNDVVSDSDDSDDESDDESDDDADGRLTKEMRAEIEESISVLDNKHSAMMKKILQGDLRPETMKKLYKNNMLPHDAIEMVVDKRIEKYFNAAPKSKKK